MVAKVNIIERLSFVFVTSSSPNWSQTFVNDSSWSPPHTPMFRRKIYHQDNSSSDDSSFDNDNNLLPNFSITSNLAALVYTLEHIKSPPTLQSHKNECVIEQTRQIHHAYTTAMTIKKAKQVTISHPLVTTSRSVPSKNNQQSESPKSTGTTWISLASFQSHHNPFQQIPIPFWLQSAKFEPRNPSLFQYQNSKRSQSDFQNCSSRYQSRRSQHTMEFCQRTTNEHTSLEKSNSGRKAWHPIHQLYKEECKVEGSKPKHYDDIDENDKPDSDAKQNFSFKSINFKDDAYGINEGVLSIAHQSLKRINMMHHVLNQEPLCNRIGQSNLHLPSECATLSAITDWREVMQLGSSNCPAMIESLLQVSIKFLKVWAKLLNQDGEEVSYTFSHDQSVHAEHKLNPYFSLTIEQVATW